MRRAIILLLIAVACTRPPDPAATPSPNRTSPNPSLATTPSPSPSASPSPGPSVLRFAAVGDIGDGSDRAARVAQAIARVHSQTRLDLILLLGDLIYPRGNPAEFHKFAGPYRPLIDSGVEIHAVLGNHDIQTDGAGVQRAFKMPAPYYSFARQLAHFYALDSSRARIDQAQRAWLENELAKASLPWKVAFTHVPSFSAGTHGSNLAIQDALDDTFDKFDVQLALAAHDHSYQRTLPQRGTTYVVAGGGCCPTGTHHESFIAARAEGLSFAVFEVNPDKTLIIAFDADGKELDRAEIPVK
jgi:3',5'-cyclic AMP phosphodiesterase CpdA